jgi:hypothetical protein
MQLLVRLSEHVVLRNKISIGTVAFYHHKGPTPRLFKNDIYLIQQILLRV